VATFVCQPDESIQSYTFYLAPYDGYALPNPEAGNLSISNISCVITPKITKVDVTYASTTKLFNVNEIEHIESSSMIVPNETVDGIDQVFSVAMTYWGNAVMDSIFKIQMTDPSLSFAQALESVIRGMIEFEGTNLRIYYAANEAPGRALVTGQYTVQRIGYNGQLLGIIAVLPPLVFILVMASGFIVVGVSTRIRFVHVFEPTNSVSLITASAAGGQAGKLQIANEQISKIDKRVLQAKLRFSHMEGLVKA
jgi:hypothetical protein